MDEKFTARLRRLFFRVLTFTRDLASLTVRNSVKPRAHNNSAKEYGHPSMEVPTLSNAAKP